MEFPSLLTQGVLLKRYKRFLAEIILNNQEHRVIYCPNMGAMLGCDALGSRIWFSHSDDPHRKFPDTWELVEVDGGRLICVNTQHAPKLILEAIQKGNIPELQGYFPGDEIFPSIEEESLDFILHRSDPSLADEPCCVVVKGVTLGDEIHRGFYPDSTETRSVEQLKALIAAKQQGYRAVLMYCVLHTGIQRLFPADHIDSDYGAMLRQAVISGVEILGYRTEISLSAMTIAGPVDVCIPARLICSS